MKRWLGLALLVFVGTAGWRIGSALSPDALSMAVGVLFGVMAGVPSALLVMAGSQRRNSQDRAEANGQRQQQRQPVALDSQMNGQMYGQMTGHMAGHMNGQMNGWQMPYAQQPPIIVVAGPQGFGGGFQNAQSNAGWLPQDAPARHFTVVGEREELVEDW